MMPNAMPDHNGHGAALKLHRNVVFGEVSIAMPMLAIAGKVPLTEAGTVHAINYSTIGVAADLTSGTGRGGARNHASRESHELTAAQIANLKAAERYAAAIGLPFTRMITIHWQAAGLPLDAMAKATGRFTDLMTKTMARHGHRTAWLWVHENGDKKGGHCHLLAHVPAEHVKQQSALQIGWLRRIARNPYRASVIYSKPIGGRLGLEVGNPALHSVNLQAAFAYLCKGAPQDVLDSNDIDRLHEPGGRIIGKRCGTSQNIGAKARRNGATK